MSKLYPAHSTVRTVGAGGAPNRVTAPRPATSTALDRCRVQTARVRDHAGEVSGSYFAEEGTLWIAAGGVCEARVCSGLPPELVAKLTLANWLYQGKL